MNKTWIIIKREYITRVRNKTFILSTLLTPLLFVGLIATITIISVKNVDKEKVAVVDPAGTLKGTLENAKAISFEFPDGVDSNNYKQKGYTAVLYVPTDSSKDYRLALVMVADFLFTLPCLFMALW
jgi:ABC-2 type transport system permease protein